MSYSTKVTEIDIENFCYNFKNALLKMLDREGDIESTDLCNDLIDKAEKIVNELRNEPDFIL